jgi:hypothetical protein
MVHTNPEFETSNLILDFEFDQQLESRKHVINIMMWLETWGVTIERRHVEYARDSYRDEFIDVPPRSYSHVPPRFYSRASPCTFSCAFPRTSSSVSPQFTHGPNHFSYGFGPRENHFEPRRFGYGPRPHHGDFFPRRSGFPAGGSFTHFEPRHLDNPRFPVVVHIPLDQVVRCKGMWKLLLVTWLSAGFLRFISVTPALSHRPLLILCRWWIEAWRTCDS